MTLIVANLVLALTDTMAGASLFAPERRIFWAIAALVSVVIAAVFTVPMFATLFELARPDAVTLAIGLATALISGGSSAGTRWRIRQGSMSATSRWSGANSTDPFPGEQEAVDAEGHARMKGVGLALWNVDVRK